MRFLGVGNTCELASLYLRLIEEGHEVKVSIAEPLCRDILAGMVTQTPDWRTDLPWIREAGENGFILFEGVDAGSGRKQDALRADGFQVIGGSAFGDRLENDRGFAQHLLQSVGLTGAHVSEFETIEQASAFLAARPQRYVLKFNGPGFSAADNYVGQLHDGRDILAMLVAKFRQFKRDRISFVLMEYVTGIEMGVGAYFNGQRFIEPACIDWEHKKFFPGDLGELTGEMGTVVTFEGTSAFFQMTLAKLAPLLRENGYCGYINLNTIVNDGGIWPLEFTCRFGYPGYSILEPLQITPWSSLLQSLVSRSVTRFEARSGFSVGVVLTTPPFPYFRDQIPESVGLPITFEGSLSDQDRMNVHLGEVGTRNGELVTAGYHGWTMVVTGIGSTIHDAQENANRLARRINVPNIRYRTDIGAKLIERDFMHLVRLGYINAR
jgi:phosphoribosylamine--glycine ligase